MEESFVTQNLAVIFYMTPETPWNKIGFHQNNFCATKDIIEIEKATYKMGASVYEFYI